MADQYPMKVKLTIQDGINRKLQTREIFDLAVNAGYNGSYRSFKNFIASIRAELSHQKPNQTDVLVRVLKQRESIRVKDLCSALSCKPSSLDSIIISCRKKGFEVTRDGDLVFLSKSTVQATNSIKQLAYKEIIFGVAGDLHFGSKAVQITALNEFCEICNKKGVKHILSPGDITAGYGVYPGQLYDLYAISPEEQSSSLLANLPNGFDWYLMGGNHDHSFISKGGLNIFNIIKRRRSDLHYLGFDDVDIPILNNTDLKMIHPSGGVPYAISYRLQKSAEQISYSELSKIAYGAKDRPSIRFILSGHLHIQMQAMFGSIFGAQTGCFEGQTNYLKRKGLFPAIGGYIIKASLGTNGLLRNFEAKFYIFNEIEDDWKHYNHIFNGDDQKIEPLFENK